MTNPHSVKKIESVPDNGTRTRSEALIRAQKKYQEKHKDKIKEVFTRYRLSHIEQYNTYQNKRVMDKYNKLHLEDHIFRAFRKLMS